MIRQIRVVIIGSSRRADNDLLSEWPVNGIRRRVDANWYEGAGHLMV